MNKKQKKLLIRILVAAALLALVNVLRSTNPFGLEGAAFLVVFGLLYGVVYVEIGYDILKKAFRGIVNRRPFDECFLMAFATLGAYAIAIYEKTGDYNEAIAVLLFYQVGEFFESYAVGKSRKNISSLMDIRPDYANIEVSGHLEQVDPQDVEIGSIIVIQPGEKVPLDGIVVEGNSTLNTSALTGESVPRSVETGSEVLGGCINMTGVIKVRTTKAFGESTVSKILELVENASSRKSQSEQFISKFARVYTPAVVYCALALAILPPAFRSLVMGQNAMWGTWIYRALTFLVISCPCALVISIPLSFFAGLGGASRDGILIKGSNYLETLSKARTIVFDKTGTLTQGVFEVTGIHGKGMEDEQLLMFASHVECSSSHPIAKSIQSAYGKDVDRSLVSDIEEISGHGVVGVVSGHKVAAGNSKLMARLGLECESATEVGTIIHLAIDGTYAGYIVISDLVKATSKAVIASLKASGVEKTIMLTGDSEKVASSVAKTLGLDEYHSELLPQDKVQKVEELLSSRSNNKSKVVFVGDGINDAPVLMRSDIGIAMGALGSDAAIEAADVVLMDDDPMKISKAIRLSRKCIGIVYQNIAIALVIKFACLILGALGFANMWAAIFADVGVMVIAVLNAIRALSVREAK